MSKSPIGKQVLDAADKDIINLSTDASKVSDKGLMGESIGKNGWAYIRNTQSYAKTSETLVHEGVHALGVGGSKRAEALARLAEVQHRGEKINIGKMREVLKDIKDAEVYENIPWKKGGTSEHFPGLEF
jgi:hypothetical protein